MNRERFIALAKGEPGVLLIVSIGMFLVGVAQDSTKSLWFGRVGLAMVFGALYVSVCRAEALFSRRAEWNSRLAERRGDDEAPSA